MKKRILCIIIALFTAAGAVTAGLFAASAATAMKTSETGIEMIKGFEGFYAKAYWDYSQWTIGYGSFAGSNPEKPDIAVITVEQADARLREQIVKYEGYVNAFLNKYSITVNQNQFDALVSFTYNFGNVWATYGDFRLKTYLINGVENYTDQEITDAFTAWCHAGGQVLPGLVIRRQKEAAYFLSGAVQDPYSPENSLPTPLRCYSFLNDEMTVTEEGSNDKIAVPPAAELTVSAEEPDGKLHVSFILSGKTIAATCTKTAVIGKPVSHYSGVTAGTADVFKRADAAEKLTSLPEQTAYSVVGESGGRIQIIFPVTTGGYRMGWIAKPAAEKYLTGRYTVNTSSGSALNIRSAASLSSSILGTMPNTTVFTATKVSGIWGAVAYQGISGWVCLDYCEFAYCLNDSWKLGESMNLRGTAAFGDNIVTVIPAGTVIKVADKIRTSSYLWGKTSFGGKTGWMVLYSFSSQKYYARTVETPVLTGVSVTYRPSKVFYTEGESADYSGLVLTARFSDGVTLRITDPAALTLSGFDPSPGNKVIIVCYTAGGVTKTASFGLTVNKGIPVEAIELSAASLPMHLGSTAAIPAEVLPDDAGNRGLTWSSTDPDVAAVDNEGVVTAVKAGFSRIVCASRENPSLTASCDVSVSSETLIPGDFSAKDNEDKSILIQWSASPGASSYILYSASAASGPYKRIAASSSLSFIHRDLIYGKEYFYKVRAVCRSGVINIYEKPSAAVSACVLPGVPDSLNAAAYSCTGFRLAWQPSEGAAGYVLYRSRQPEGPYTRAKVTAQNNCTDTGLIPGGFYYYKIRAYTTFNEKNIYGLPSAALRAQVTTPTPLLPRATPNSSTSLLLSWQAVPDATGYVVYLSQTTAGPFERLAVTKTAAYSHKNLLCGSVYYYKVTAYRSYNSANYYGKPSVAFCEKAQPPVPPDFKAAAATSAGVKLTWSASSGASGYIVYRADNAAGPYTRVKVTRSLGFTDTGLVKSRTYCYKVRAYTAASSGNVYGYPSAAVVIKV